MTKHVYTNEVWCIYPAIGLHIGENLWELHISWLCKDLVLTFKKKSRGSRTV